MTEIITAAALVFILSQHASKSDRVTFTLEDYEIHGKEHLYNASVGGDIYMQYTVHICGYLGVVISQLYYVGIYGLSLRIPRLNTINIMGTLLGVHPIVP